MSREIYGMIPAKYRRKGRSARRVLWITTSNDGRERVLTETRFQLNVKGHTVAADFVIIENCHTGIILGMETLADMRCVIECQMGTAPRQSNEEGRGMRHPWIDGKWMAGRNRGHQGMAREEGHKE